MSHITTCTVCGKCYEEFSEEPANKQTRECGQCWMKREDAEHEEREFAEAERQISTGGF
jgi:hypothetical protein